MCGLRGQFGRAKLSAVDGLGGGGGGDRIYILPPTVRGGGGGGTFRGGPIEV